MLASRPACSLNQIPADLGIPSDSTKSGKTLECRTRARITRAELHAKQQCLHVEELAGHRGTWERSTQLALLQSALGEHALQSGKQHHRAGRFVDQRPSAQAPSNLLKPL